MILSGKEIAHRVDIGDITIDPFDHECINPNSYNYKLGDTFCIVPNESSSGKSIGQTGEIQVISSQGLLLIPGNVYLASTYESIGSNKFVTSLIGRSSVGRLGLFLQISADLGNLGPAHKWTLELTCVQPIIVYPRMKIGQVSFWVPSGAILEYTGPYTDYDTPQQCIYHRLQTGEL